MITALDLRLLKGISDSVARAFSQVPRSPVATAQDGAFVAMPGPACAISVAAPVLPQERMGIHKPSVDRLTN